MYAFNIYLGYGKSFVSTFSQAPVGVRWEPCDPMVFSDVNSAREAESAQRLITKLNNQKDLQAEIAMLSYTDGVIVFHSQMKTDGDGRLGFTPNGEPRPYPAIEVGGLLEWKVPIASGGFEDWDYARHQKDISLTRAKADYPTKAKKLKAGQSKDIDYSRQARMSVAEGLGMQTQSGDAQTVGTRTRYWLRPSAFWDIEDEALRGEVESYFPKGAYVCFYGEEYVESRDEKMDDHLTPLKAVKGDGFATQGLGDVELGPQETFNVLANLARITFVRGVPHSFFDEQMIPAEARNNQVSTPGVAHPITRPMDGSDLGSHFYQEQPAETPMTMTQYLDNVQGPLSQFLTGQQPALFGGEMGEAGQTSSGYAQAREQAMGLMGLTWVPFKKAWCSVMRQCVRMMPKAYDPGTKLATVFSQNNGSQETVSVDVDNLRGNMLCYPDSDENFPESWGAKKAAFQQLVMGAKDLPELGGILMHPDNLRLAKDYSGLQDLTIPGADSCEKQMMEIEEMEQQPPVPDPQAIQQIQQARQMGQPIPPQMLQQLPMISSIQIDQFDDNAMEFQTCVRWINSPAGQKAKRETPQWYQNVSLHAQAHQKALQANQPGPQNKPPSVSINYKDLPPAGQVQAAGEAGIQIQPTDVVAQQAAALQNKQASSAAQ